MGARGQVGLGSTHEITMSVPVTLVTDAAIPQGSAAAIVGRHLPVSHKSPVE